MKHIKDKLRVYVKNRLGVNTKERFVANINLDITRKQTRVLLVYLDLYYSSKQIRDNTADKKRGTCHTNRSELFQIINCFIKLDCCIDVCANDDKDAIQYINNYEYDIILGLGDIFRYAAKNTRAYKILYMTENPYNISLVRETERIEYFKQRNGKDIPIYKTGKFFKKNDEKIADAIICMGDEKYYQYLNKPVERIFPSAFYNARFSSTLNRKKKSFLVLGTDGFVHKGIDLLVEVFNKHLDWNLYICGYHVNEEMKRLGLRLTSNIHDCGYIDVLGDEFVSLAEECTYILLPSCSEATATAVLTGMRHAMIPVVMHGNGFDEFAEYCYFFDGFKIEQIEEKICQILEEPEENVEKLCIKISKYANEQFSLEHFTERLYAVLKRFVEEQREIKEIE